MKSYYALLGVEPNASHQTIKEAYRRQVKALHPDLNQGDPASVEQIKLLVRAYETLGHPDRRAEYDRIHRVEHAPRQGFDYADFLRSRGDDRESQSKLIFYDLLHDNPEEALQLYALLVASGDFELSRYLDREDFMDCAFLLAEEYEQRQEFVPAFELLAAIVRFERRKPYFRHFMTEVHDRLRRIVCSKMALVAPSEITLRYLHQLIDWDLSKRETAFFYKKAAEILFAEGDRRGAIRYLQRALAADPRVPGAKKLQQELGYVERVDV